MKSSHITGKKSPKKHHPHLRIILCICLMTGVLAICLTGSLYVRHETKEMLSGLEKAEKYLKNDEKSGAMKEIEQVKETWEKLEIVTDMLMHSRTSQDICISVSKLKPYLETDNDELYAELSACAQLLQCTYERYSIII